MLKLVFLYLSSTHDAQKFFIMTCNLLLWGLEVCQAEVDGDWLRECEEVETLYWGHQEVLEEHGHFWWDIGHEQFGDILDEEGGERESRR